jgi:hypothetical protein
MARASLAFVDRTDGLNLQGDALSNLAHVLGVAGQTADAAVALTEALERYERKGNLAAARRVQERLGCLRPT